MIRRILSAILLSSTLLVVNAQAATDWCAFGNTKLCVKFEDAAGSGTIADSAAGSDNGTVNNSTGVTQHTTGKYGFGVTTTAGNNAKATFGGNPADNLTSISVAIYMNNTTLGTAGTISDKAAIYSKGYRSGTLAFQTTNQLRWAEHWDGGTANYDTTNGSVTTSTWQHYAATFNRSSISNLPLIYVDGVSQTVSNPGACCSARDDDSGSTIAIFQDSLDGGETNSLMDELIVYSGILTSTDINEIKDNGVDGTNGSVSATYSGRGIGRAIGRGIGR